MIQAKEQEKKQAEEEQTNRKGLIHIYTGDGKGKTTAAIGLAVRAKGAGLRVLVAQLFKDYSNGYSCEVKVLKAAGIDYMTHSVAHPFFKKYSVQEFGQEAEKCTTFIRDVFSKMKKESYDLVVIDEIGPALSCKFLKEEELIDMINSKPKYVELVMTGRGFSDRIEELADYFTEMKMKKHPYVKGAKPRKGVDY